MKDKRLKKLLVFLADTLLLALLLGGFAYTYYTPTTQTSLNIVSNIPQKTKTVEVAETVEETATAEPEATPAEGTSGAVAGEESLAATVDASELLVSSTGLSTRGNRSRGSSGNSNPVAVDTSTDSAQATAETQVYEADGVKIEVQELATSDGRVEYILAELWLEDVTDLKTAFAYDTYGTGYVDSVPNMDTWLNAILTVNGDYYGNGTSGIVARNGVIYRANPTNADILLLYADGSMAVKSYAEFDAQTEANAGLWQAWTFGPSLLDSNGNAISNFNVSGHMNSRNPRTVLGYFENGHYGILVINGRGDSEGLSLAELSALCEDIGFTIAYNLDGGKSSVMVYNDEVINQPAGGGREISDVIYIAEGA